MALKSLQVKKESLMDGTSRPREAPAATQHSQADANSLGAELAASCQLFFDARKHGLEGQALGFRKPILGLGPHDS